MKISGWGKYPLIKAKVKSPSSIEELILTISKGDAIARGNGRSYGDSSISKNNTICMRNFNKIIEFNNISGLLVVESGVLLSKIIETYLPQGWFPKVTPGSKFVSIGGMVACDIHGKNHHKFGSFGNCIEWIDLITDDSEIKRCSKKFNSELFDWTIGGMGLTGVIYKVGFYLHRIKTSWVKQKIIPTKNINETIKIFEDTLDTTYSVAWIDCLSKGDKLGRSLVMLGEHAELTDLVSSKKKNPLKIEKKYKIRIPFNFPSFFLNSFSMKIFNSLYYFLGTIKKNSLVDFDKYFYPLDSILDWNKVYGKNGFAQFQCVIPLKNSLIGISELIDKISRSDSTSFLTVLKRFGKEERLISFPMEGYTLTIDFPMTDKNLELMKQLDEITLNHKGRFYLAKDSRMSKDILQRSDVRFKKYSEFRSSKMKMSFSSEQSKRLEL
jgi:hypothetical protein